ncbi:hypothetical protein B0H14DRAFT_2588990 [Mycena olivaceomarginata]|nr:hypothetical protein B0H14DRAFT_2588990 [Mycena olivaceomarginata]
MSKKQGTIPVLATETLANTEKGPTATFGCDDRKEGFLHYIRALLWSRGWRLIESKKPAGQSNTSANDGAFENVEETRHDTCRGPAVGDGDVGKDRRKAGVCTSFVCQRMSKKQGTIPVVARQLATEALAKTEERPVSAVRQRCTVPDGGETQLKKVAQQ